METLDQRLGLAMSRRDERTRMRVAIGVCILVLLWGTLGMHWIEGWSLWESFYFTVITITTVGYGDHGASELGQQYATALMLIGIGAVSYTFAAVVQGMVANQFAWRRRMQARIDKLEKHVILCGYDRMGHTIRNELVAAGRPFVVIEADVEKARLALEQGCFVLQGDATQEDILRQAGLERATHLVVALPDSSDKIVAVLTARGLRSDLIVLACADREEEIRKLELAGVDRTVSPFLLGGIEMAQRILRPKVADFLSHQSSDTKLALANVDVQAGSPLVGRTLSELGKETYTHVCFVTLERPGERVQTPPRGTSVLAAGDSLIIAGEPEQVAEMHGAGAGSSAPGEESSAPRAAA